MSKVEKLIKVMEEVKPSKKSAAGILFRHANEVFLVKHSKLKKWVTPGGMKEDKDGSDLRSTAIREMREECGMLPGYADTGKSAQTSSDTADYTTFLWQPDHKFEHGDLQADEVMEAKWWPLDKLPKDLYEHTADAMKQIGCEMLNKPAG